MTIAKYSVNGQVGVITCVEEYLVLTLVLTRIVIMIVLVDGVINVFKRVISVILGCVGIVVVVVV